MNKARVVWGCRKPIGPDQADEVRTMTREFGTAKAAAAFACDIIFMIDGPASASASTDKFYIVGRDKPRARYDNRIRTQWVEVTYLAPGVGSVPFSAAR